MKVSIAVRMTLMAGALLAAMAAGAQAPATTPPAGGMGNGWHRPPMERALGPDGEHGRWWNDATMVAKLKLTDDQRKSMDDVLLEHRETLVQLRANLEKSELLLEPLMKADQPDEAKIVAQIDQVAQARAELEKANARFLLAIRSKLTPDQWKALQAERANRPRPEFRRNWRPGGQGPQAAPPDGTPQGRLDGGPGQDGPPAPDAGLDQ